MMSTAGPLSGVGMTALGVARLRAEESRRPDRLFDDPLAAAFVNAVPDAFPENTSVDDWLSVLLFHGSSGPGSFDEYLLAATAHGCRQILLLAAGLDTRAFRLDWPSGTRLIELDLPEVMAFKDTILTEQAATPRCERTMLHADLCGHWSGELTRVGFRRSEPTAWLAEGLLLYLSAHEVDRLLTTVTDLSADGSRLALDYGSPPTIWPSTRPGPGR
jgi:methyltransferase (TIGR00027 family)